MASKLRTALPLARRLAAQTVRQARECAGLTQEAAAQRYGVGVRTLRDIEAGKARMTALELVIELQLAAASSSREEQRHAPAIALVVDGAASGLTQTDSLKRKQECSGFTPEQVNAGADVTRATSRLGEAALKRARAGESLARQPLTAAARVGMRPVCPAGLEPMPAGEGSGEVVRIHQRSPFFLRRSVAPLQAPQLAPSRACTENAPEERQCSGSWGVTAEGEAASAVAKEAA